MTLLLLSVALLLSFYLLARVCDEYFVSSLDKVAEKLKMSSDVAGATLMAVGSSAPELFVSIIALVKPGGHGAVGMGTIIGSALFNILVIVGVSAVVMKKAKLCWQPVIRDVIFYSVSILVLLFSFRDGNISMNEALIFVGMYILYVIAVMNWRKIMPYEDIDVIEEFEEGKNKEEEKKSKLASIMKPLDKVLSIFFPNPKHYNAIFLISIAIIAALSWVLVECAVEISHILHIPASIVALTVLAIGTSIPDLISSVIVAKQGRGGMAISNAMGSNIFDILFGLGVPWLFVLAIKGESIKVSTENLMSSVILLFATVLVILFLLISRKWKIGYRAGWFLIILYLAYLAWAISRIIL